MDTANKEQALRARDLGAKYLREANYEKAVRFLEKSVSMASTPEAQALLAKARRGPPPPDADPNPAASNGARRRPAAASASASRPAKPTPNPREPVPDARPFTAEQAQMVKQIKRCKDLYAMLGVAKTADTAAIKRAYRKKAVQVHPDKNSAPGADEAFKEIGRAWSILGDVHKRAEYDQFGETSDNPAQQYARRYHQDDFDPADIFREVFGANFAGMGGPGVRMYNFGGGPGMRGGARQAQTAAPQTPLGGLLQLLPLLLLFLMSFASMPGIGTQQQPFAFKQSGQFPVRRDTGLPDVAPGIPFFVGRDFHRTVGRTYAGLREVERTVQAEHVREMERRCGNDKLRRQRAMHLARARGDRDAERIEFEREFSACQEVDRVYGFLNSRP